MKRILSLIICFALLLSGVGCSDSQREEESKVDIVLEEDEGMGPLQVYCLEYDVSDTVKPYIKTFENSEIDIELEITSFDSIEELENSLKNSGKADVIILDGYVASTMVNPFEWAEDGYLQGLSPYFAADEAYDEGNYINGVMDAGRYDGELYMVPLSIGGQFWLVNSEEVESGGLTALQDEASMKLIMETLINDAEKHEGEKYYSQIVRTLGYVYDTGEWLYACLEQTGAVHVDRDSQTVTIDEKMFELTMKYLRATYPQVSDYSKNKSAYMEVSVGELDGMSTAFLNGGNMIFETGFISSAYHQLLERNVVLLPFKMSNDGYAFSANIVGMVSSESKQPIKACAFLKALMDMPHENWEEISGIGGFRSMTPVNQNELEELIVSYETVFGTPYEMQHQAFEREKLPEDLADQLRQVYANTEKVFIMDVDVLNILNMYLNDYMEGNTDDLDGIAEKIKTDIEAMLK